jgi:hypothetical protein
MTGPVERGKNGGLARGWSLPQCYRLCDKFPGNLHEPLQPV